jgi:D-alanyl-lipoteichoic acid acyltransferase DltB (MBOAT superfamily)
MLFNSGQFLFFFLPVVVTIFFVIGSCGWREIAAAWLALASLVFYGWENPSRLIPIILVSATFNYIMGVFLASTRNKVLLFISVGANLLVLSYFKYIHFIISSINDILNINIIDVKVSLPIGISFFTFTQIAFLVDTQRGEARETKAGHYLLFVTYFPHLIAGPIIHHKEMMPQFARPETYKPRLENIALGFSYFAAGLFKKTVLADGISDYVSPIFSAASKGQPLLASEAWIGVLSYTLQIYFDFSGYSDMAIGLAKIMGIDFPLNFNSPYKSASIIDFWRRWHMTLSRFLRDYLYFPLGGNRKSSVRRYANLMITMVLGGLWHGASWNFVVWGAIHGFALLINHAWRNLAGKATVVMIWPIGWALTMFVAIFAWVPFRAESFSETWLLWKDMFGFGASGKPVLSNALSHSVRWIIVLFSIALLFPNTQEIMNKSYARFRFLLWRPTLPWAVAFGLTFGLGIAAMEMQNSSQFLYFRF